MGNSLDLLPFSQKSFIKPFILGVCLTLTADFMLPGAVYAEDTAKLGTIEVTGYRIKRTDAEGPSHVLQIERDAIEKSGANTLTELLSSITVGTVATESFALTDAPGASGINLRNLGLNRTLVLINGRRSAPNAAATNTIESFVDLNGIPLVAVERIEILKDGASAIYGADAVAGVVNIILRKDYEGASVTVGAGQTSDGDAGENTLSLLAGKAFGKTNVTVGFNYFTRDGMLISDIDGVNALDDPTGFPGSYFVPSLNDISVDPACGDPQYPSSSIQPLGPFATVCHLNLNPFTTSIPETDRYSITLLANHELNADTSAFAEISFNNSETKTQLPPTPLNPDNGTFSNPVPDSAFNPFGETVFPIIRFGEVGNRVSDADADSLRLVLGIKGILGELDWESSILYSKSTIDEDILNYISRSALQAALSNSTFNPFAGANNSQAVLDSLRAEIYRKSETSLVAAELFATGPAGEWEMDGGPVYVAGGVQLRHEELEDAFNDVVQSGDVLGFGGLTSASKGDRDVLSAFVEYSMPATEDLELQVAARLENYDTHGNTLDPKLGFRYQVNDMWMIRGSTGTAFRAPSLAENYIADNVTFQGLIDTERCNAVGLSCTANDTQINAGGNPELDPETASFFNLGAAAQITDDLSMTIDYWRINHRDIIAQRDAQRILDTDGLNTELVVRGAPTVAGDPGPIQFVNTDYTNFAAQETNGIDLDIKYDTGSWYAGTFASYLIEFKRKTNDIFEGYDGKRVGFYSYPHLKTQAYAGINQGDWSGQVTANYRSSIDHDSSGKLGSHSTVDLQANYTGFKDLTLTVGGVNIFDKNPPTFPTNGVDRFGYEWGTIDPRGAFWYMRLKYDF